MFPHDHSFHTGLPARGRPVVWTHHKTHHSTASHYSMYLQIYVSNLCLIVKFQRCVPFLNSNKLSNRSLQCQIWVLFCIPGCLPPHVLPPPSIAPMGLGTPITLSGGQVNCGNRSFYHGQCSVINTFGQIWILFYTIIFPSPTFDLLPPNLTPMRLGLL